MLKKLPYLSLILMFVGFSASLFAGRGNERHAHDRAQRMEAPAEHDISAQAVETPEQEVTADVAPATAPATQSIRPKTSSKSYKDLNRTEKRAKRADFRKKLREYRKNNTLRTKGDHADFIVCLILAILIPPLGVYLHEDITTNFWISLILTILGWGLAFIWVPYAALAAVVFSILVVVDVI